MMAPIRDMALLTPRPKDLNLVGNTCHYSTHVILTER